MKKHLITAAIVVLAVTPALAQPSVKTDTTVNVIYSADKFKVETNHFKYDWFINVRGGAQIYFLTLAMIHPTCLHLCTKLLSKARKGDAIHPEKSALFTIY